MGRKKTPTKILNNRGSWRGDRPDEPQGDDIAPECPDWLQGDARAKWFELVPKLRNMGVLSSIDAGALARYCDLWGLYRESRQLLGHKLAYAEGPEDNKKARLNPLCNYVDKLSTQLTKLEAVFGLNPSARAGLSTEKPKDMSKLAKYRKNAG